MNKFAPTCPTTVFCGIDVSARSLSVALIEQDRSVSQCAFANSASGHKALLGWLGKRQQPIKRPKVSLWLGVIDAILDDDKRRPAKQRPTAKRIFERLKEEHRFTGGYTIVKDHVRSAELHSR
jgi:hypothetical protein